MGFVAPAPAQFSSVRPEHAVRVALANEVQQLATAITKSPAVFNTYLDEPMVFWGAQMNLAKAGDAAAYPLLTELAAWFLGPGSSALSERVYSHVGMLQDDHRSLGADLTCALVRCRLSRCIFKRLFPDE